MYFYSVHLLHIYMMLRFVGTSINTHDDDDYKLKFKIKLQQVYYQFSTSQITRREDFKPYT